MKNFTVTIHNCQLGKQTHSIQVEADDEGGAKTAAVRRIYGKNAYIEPNHYHGPRYGQVFTPIQNGSVGSSCSPLLRIDAEQV